MVQNRNKFITSFIGNISNAVVHEILEKAIEKEELISKYRKEFSASFEVAKEYRNKINPTDRILPDGMEIKREVIKKVETELNNRISKGYKNIDLDLVEETVDRLLNDMKVI